MVHIHSSVRRWPDLLLALWATVAPLAAAPRGTLLERGPLAIDPIEHLAAHYNELLNAALGKDPAEAFRRSGVQSLLQALIRQNRGTEVLSRTLKYASEDAGGRGRIYSGRIYFPTNPVRSWQAGRIPLVFYQQDTQTRRDLVPFRDQGDEALVGALGAQLFGFAVAMPDGDGMGEDPSPAGHAFYQAATTSRCLLDMVRAVEEGGAGRMFDATGYVWDGTTYLAGYGEGGFTAVAALRELRTAGKRSYGDLTVEGAACMAGPLDFSGALVQALRDGVSATPQPFLPAVFLAAWQNRLSRDLSLRGGLNPRLLGRQPSLPGGPDQLGVEQWLDGRLAPDEINLRIRARLTGDPRSPVTARSVLDEAWVKANLDPADSRLVRVLRRDDLAGDWIPPCPVLLGQVRDDPWAGPGASRALVDSWRRRGFEPVRTALESLPPQLGPVMAMPLAFLWFKLGLDPAFRSRARTLLDRPTSSGQPGWAD